MPSPVTRSSTATQTSRVRANPSIQTSGSRSARSFDSIRGNVEIVTPLPRGFKISPRAPVTEVIQVRRELGHHWIGDIVALPLPEFTEQANGFKVKSLTDFNEVPVGELSMLYFFQYRCPQIVNAIAAVSSACAVRAENYKATRTRTAPRKWRVQKQRNP